MVMHLGSLDYLSRLYTLFSRCVNKNLANICLEYSFYPKVRSESCFFSSAISELCYFSSDILSCASLRQSREQYLLK